MYKVLQQKLWAPPCSIAKLLLIMRLTILILITGILQVSASSYAQKISLSEKNASLTSVLDHIRLQTGYDFFYKTINIKNLTNISIKAENEELKDVLLRILQPYNLDYEIDDNSVIIKKKEASFLDRIAGRFEAIDIRGRVLDENNKPLIGATVRIKGKRGYLTNKDGEFYIRDAAPDAVLEVSYLGYKVKEMKVSEINGIVNIVLELLDNNLNEVEIVNTGYQKLPKERATGSFEQVSNALFNRKTSTDILSRLDGVITSFVLMKIINPTPIGDPLQQIGIRGGRALTSYSGPLLVVDDFPYDGDARNINPNDVESVTILKDAAAASIWGSRASNGVIVITTKKGQFEQPLNISINSNLSIANKPDLYALNRMSSSDYIDLEQFLFNKGFYDRNFNPSSEFQTFKTPVLEILNKQKINVISTTQAKAQLDELRNVDTREDFLKYIYRPATNQQYAMNITGGSKQLSYLFAAGYDKNQNSLVTSSYDRMNIRSNTTFRPLKNLEIQTGLTYMKRNYRDISPENAINYVNGFTLGGNRQPAPYLRLVDAQGNAQVINYGFYPSQTYRESEMQKGLLLNWQYRPLAELNASSEINTAEDLLLNLGASYQLHPIFKASLKYQYEKTNGLVSNYNGLDSYYTRDYINQFTQYNATQVTKYAVPIGDMQRNTNNTLQSQGLRGQIDAHKNWNQAHDFNALIGTEIREVNKYSFTQSRLYGYSPNTLTYTPVDFSTLFPQLNSKAGTNRIFDGAGYFNTRKDRYISTFANVAYSYQQKYTISASARADGSNLFGVKQNNKFQPLWSAGAAWTVSNENFYASSLLPYLKLRLTYGYLGNANNSTSAYPSINYSSTADNVNNQIFATGGVPPNDNLRWEKTGQWNFGLDFGTKNNRLTGTLEYFNKHSTDLIAATIADPTTGFTTYNVNSANTHGYGWDAMLNSINLKGKDWSWQSTVLFSYNRTILTKYLAPAVNPSNYLNFSNFGITLSPKTGRDLVGLYTLKFAGLDPLTGDPIGYLNGIPSKNYSALRSPTSIDDLEYHGSTRPVYFGAFRNTFNWKAFSFSVNLQYKLGYYFQYNSTNYGLFTQSNFSIYNYDQRWKQPGDEVHTKIPSQVYPFLSSRDEFYNKSAAAAKADHIRLQDITLDYNFSKINRSIKNIKLYANASNLGVIWKANKVGLDPDYLDTNLRPPLTFAFGLTANF